MDFSLICRTCLSSRSLNPIFENPDDKKRYSSALLMIAGIQVEINDGLPQKMCASCINILNNSLKFRKQCKDVEIKLLEAKRLTLSKNQLLNSSDLSMKLSETERHGEGKENLVTNEENYSSDFVDDDDDDDDKPLRCLANNLTEDLPNAPLADDESKNSAIEHSLKLVKRNTRKITKKCKYKKERMKKSDLPYQESFSVGEKKQRVTCRMCQKDLSIRSIDTHMARMHPGADERKVKCDLCDRYVFGDKMKRHVVMMHGEDCYKCGYCKTEYANRELLIDHVTTCTAKNRKRKVNESGRQMQECDVCHKMMQKASLRMHKAIKHAGLRPVCEHCGKKFGNKFRLNEHYRAKHGYEKFKCSYCEFQSARILSLRNHERRHRGEKPFVCETCGAKFHAAYLLAQHRHSHRTERLIKCDGCPARFKARNSLHAHRLARKHNKRTAQPTDI